MVYLISDLERMQNFILHNIIFSQIFLSQLSHLHDFNFPEYTVCYHIKYSACICFCMEMTNRKNSTTGIKLHTNNLMNYLYYNFSFIFLVPQNTLIRLYRKKKRHCSFYFSLPSLNAILEDIWHHMPHFILFLLSN